MMGESIKGWNVKGIIIHPTEAYTDIEYWFNHFCASLPEKAEKMVDYSEKHGWSKLAHKRWWPSVCIKWLNHNYPRK